VRKEKWIWQLLLALLLAAPLAAGAQEGAWTRKADMPATWGYQAAAVVGGKIYVMGGLFGSLTEDTPCQVYDPAGGTWKRRAPSSLARMWQSAVALDGRIYTVGGMTETGPVRAVEVYEPSTDTWASRAGMLTPRMGLATCAVNGKIYAIGGFQGDFRAWPKPIRGSFRAAVEEYDPVKDTWTKKADMPTPRAGIGVAVVGGLIYVLGGTNDGLTACPAIEVYDPATDTWTSKGTMPEPRCDFCAITIGQKICALGGLSGGWPGFVDDSAIVFTNSVVFFDPASDTWSPKPDMNVRRADFGASVVDGRIYVFGGLASPKWNAVTKSMEAWDTGVRE